MSIDKNPCESTMGLIQKYILVVAGMMVPGLALGLAVECSCAEPPEPLVALEGADLVFTAVVGSLETDRIAQSVRADLRITESLKGTEKGHTIPVYTGLNSAACGYPFRQGGEYLVYAQREKNLLLRTGLCTRTKRLSAAGKEVEVLRGDVQPEKLVTKTPTTKKGAPDESWWNRMQIWLRKALFNL